MAAFRRNPSFKHEIEATPKFEKGMASVANEIARHAVAAAPKKTGYYARRVKGRGSAVVATDPFAHLVELGSVNNPPYAPLRKGVRAAGHRFADPGRS